jgi:ubiquinone/menaquinone biosynthesis C-methylase UbiE
VEENKVLDLDNEKKRYIEENTKYMHEDKKPAWEEEKKDNGTDQKYYDEQYFATASKEIVDKNTGEKKVWGYQGTDWSGHFFIVKGILETFNAEFGSILDIGAGQASFTDYALRAGLKAKAYDFSEWAVARPHNFAQGHLFLGDATNITEEDNSWDVVYCSDLLEHLPKSKVHLAIKEFYRVSRKWVFLQFPVSGMNPNVDDSFDWEIHDKAHKFYAHYMIARHLNMSFRKWWDELFTSIGFKIREDLVKKFRENTPSAVLDNWFNIVILEK